MINSNLLALFSIAFEDFMEALMHSRIILSFLELVHEDRYMLT